MPIQDKELINQDKRYDMYESKMVDLIFFCFDWVGRKVQCEKFGDGVKLPTDGLG